MRTATALLATLIPLVGVGGWLVGSTAGDRWRASALPSRAEEEPNRGSLRPRIDLVVEYAPPPVEALGLETRAPPVGTYSAAADLAPATPSTEPSESSEHTVMQRLLTLYEKIGRAP